MPKEKFYRNGQMNFKAEWGACKHPEHSGRNCMGLLVEGGHIFEPGNSEHLEDLDRLIAALKRAKRAMLGTSSVSAVDAVIDGQEKITYTLDEWRRANGFLEQDAPSKATPKFDLEQRVVALSNGWAHGTGSGQVVEGKIYTIVGRNFRTAENDFRYGVAGESGLFSEDLFRAAAEEKHDPYDICPVPGCNCDLDYREAQVDSPIVDRLHEVLKRWDEYLAQSEKIYTKKNLPDYQKGIAGARDDIRKILEN